jgi:hypothetical protein
LNEDKNDQKKN